MLTQKSKVHVSLQRLKCDGTVFLSGFEKWKWRQPYCLLGSSLVRQKTISSLGLFVSICSLHVIVGYCIDHNN